MPNHKQPTKEELDAQEKAAIEEAEKIEKDGVPIEEDKEEEPKPEEKEEEVVESSKPVEEDKEEEPPSEPPEEDKLKKKLSASARENQKIYAKNRVMNKALAEADDIPEPTEEELKTEYADWEDMSDTERKFAKETVVSRKWREVISSAKDQASKIEKWNDSVDSFLDDPKTLNDNPDLEGKGEAFREFALIEANNSVPFNILVSAFLHEHSKAKPSNKGKMFEKGSGGPNEKPIPKTDKLNLEQARRLRDTNYTKYKEYLQAGKIEIDL